jgi:hypothetical protein
MGSYYKTSRLKDRHLSARVQECARCRDLLQLLHVLVTVDGSRTATSQCTSMKVPAAATFSVDGVSNQVFVFFKTRLHMYFIKKKLEH